MSKSQMFVILDRRDGVPFKGSTRQRLYKSAKGAASAIKQYRHRFAVVAVDFGVNKKMEMDPVSDMTEAEFYAAVDVEVTKRTDLLAQLQGQNPSFYSESMKYQHEQIVLLSSMKYGNLLYI